MPTLLVLGPGDGQVLRRWIGSLDVPALLRFLDEGERALRDPETAGDGTPAGELRRGRRLHAEGQVKEAEAVLRQALPGAPPAIRAGLVETLVLLLIEQRDFPRCAEVAAAEAATLPRGSSFANVAATGLTCALLSPPSTVGRQAQRAAVEPLAGEALALPALLADDRSGLFEALVEARKEAADAPGARQLAARWLAFLEGEAATAPTASARAAFDPHRVAAALALGAPERAVDALRASEGDLPADYNAPARLALLYQAMGRLDEALGAIERALGKVYGPRRVRLLEQRAEILLRRHEGARARASLEEALALAESLPAVQQRERLVGRVRERLAALERP